ncbi:MAG: hypothetical protein JSR60_08135 [Proteobacteria bacterium]|nr:hypothetical protein [Pseudomonadota bacterium]
MRVRIAVGVALAAFALVPANGQWTIRAHTVQALAFCRQDKLFDAMSTGAPPRISVALSGRGSVLAFRICTDADGNEHYFVRQPRPNRAGVCRVLEDEVFPAKRPSEFVNVSVPTDVSSNEHPFGLAGWTDRAPAAWRRLGYRSETRSFALVTEPDGRCPLPDDTRFIPVTASDGALREFQRLWHAATATPQDFYREFGSAPVLNSIPSGVPKQATAYFLLHDLVFDRHADISSIECQTGSTGTDTCSAWIGNISIEFDVSGQGLVVTGIRESPVF